MFLTWKERKFTLVPESTGTPNRRIAVGAERAFSHKGAVPMTKILTPRRILFAALALGLSAGGAAGLGTTPLAAAEVAAAKGHGHWEPDGSLFCHCTGTFCSPCASTEAQ
jgi:hypothetical protein